jgi:ribosomal protein S18 acetylase RimI-like enzyme
VNEANSEIEIQPAAAPADLTAARDLFVEYAESLDYDTCFEGFDQEISEFPGAYGSPRGALLIAVQAGQPVDAVGLWPLDEDAAEMKRLYVKPHARGLGIGRQLAAGVIEEAERLAYKRLELETLPRMAEARALYRDLGFEAQFSGASDGIERIVLEHFRTK